LLPLFLPEPQCGLGFQQHISKLVRRKFFQGAMLYLYKVAPLPRLKCLGFPAWFGFNPTIKMNWELDNERDFYRQSIITCIGIFYAFLSVIKNNYLCNYCLGISPLRNGCGGVEYRPGRQPDCLHSFAGRGRRCRAADPHAPAVASVKIFVGWLAWMTRSSLKGDRVGF